jgi:DNA-binding NtrC family response regulator/serine/threonine protein kinase/tetratricopeptide (TPR) repeat protein
MAARPPRALLPPRYRLLRELGRGGAGTVYLVHDQHLGREVAFKLLHKLLVGQEEVRQLEREFKLLAGLEHPGIARAHDFGFLERRPYFTREYIEGDSPGMKAGLFSLESLLQLAREVANATAFLHRGEILHLDIKPSNILTPTGPSPRPAVLIDFGLCRRGIHTLEGNAIKGSLPYMAPEYFRGGALGPWTDVYALGVTLYYLATGLLPRLGGMETARPVRDGLAWLPAPLPPSHHRGGLPRFLDALLLKCLALDPRARFPSAKDLLEALLRAEGGRPNSRSPPAAPASPASPLVGRQEELASAHRFLEGIRIHVPSSPALLVTGLPGMGQSRFLLELKINAQTLGFQAYLESGCPGRPGPSGSLLRCLGSHLGKRARKARGEWEALFAKLRKPSTRWRHDLNGGEQRFRHYAELAQVLSATVEPFLLVVDGLHFCDEISVAMLIEMVRLLARSSGPQRPPVGLVFGYREEGPLLPLLRELTTEVLDRTKGEVVTLGPLGLRETLELAQGLSLDLPGTVEAESRSGFELFQQTGGSPARIAALFRSGPEAPPEGRSAGPGSPPPPANTLACAERRMLLALELLSRPARAGELGAILNLSPGKTLRITARLEARGKVQRIEERGAPSAWVLGPHAAPLSFSAPAREIRALHSRIATALLKRGRKREGLEIVEAASHFRRSGDRKATARHALRAAHALISTFQIRSALEHLRSAREALPRKSTRRRLEIALEMAGLHARTGDLDEGVRLLRDSRAASVRLPPAVSLRTLLRLATLHSRRGDFQRADAHFREGLASARRTPGLLTRHERLEFLNEHAAVKAFLSDYPEARRLCREGLLLAGASRSFRTREVALNLQATLANVALRTQEFEEAASGFQKALQIAEAIGSLSSQAVVLNNLGIVYSQCERAPEAVRAFREAERTCLRLQEGPPLVSIRGNLAALEAKRGDFQAANDALEAAQELRPAEIGKRQELFLHHARGLCRLHEGCYLEALPSLEAAIRMAEGIGDRHIAVFDNVYRAEALVFSGAYTEAENLLQKLSADESAPLAQRAALARLALLGAFTARGEMVAGARAKRKALPSGRPIGYLDAVEEMFLGWARSMGGDHQAARLLLSSAEDFFGRHGLRPGLSLVRWVQAESYFLEGNSRAAQAILSAPPGPTNRLTRILWPLLKARLLLDELDSPGARGRMADALAEAGFALSENNLPEWAARHSALRWLLQPEAGAAQEELQQLRSRLARELPEPARKDYLASGHFRAWSGDFERRKKRTGNASRPQPGPSPGDSLSGTRTISSAAPSDTGNGLPGGARLVARSRAMQGLLEELNRIRKTALPVLIRGETGTGKELVARRIHAESDRANRPFTVVDSAALPSALLEAELFGARAGSFTDGKDDRPGILALARGGTVLLDEVAALELEAQGKLLRTLAEGTIRPLGAETEERLDVRFLATTSRDLENEVREGRFRLDLLHRIRVLEVRVPPLRERLEDLPELSAELLREICGAPLGIQEPVLERLAQLNWPGNVRELRNLLSRLAMESSGRIGMNALEKALGRHQTTTFFPRPLLLGRDLPALKTRLERDYLLQHLRRLQGDPGALCLFLGVRRRQLYRRLERFGISLRRERKKPK